MGPVDRRVHTGMLLAVLDPDVQERIAGAKRKAREALEGLEI